MEKEIAIRELPEYSRAELPRTHTRMDKDEFVKRYGIFLIVAVVFTLYTILLSAMVSHRTEKRVRAEMTAQFEQEAEADREAKANAEKASQFLTGEKSKQAAIDTLKTPIAQHISYLRMERHVTADGARTYVWGVDLARLNSGRYGDIYDVLNGNVEGYKEGYPTRREDEVIAEEIATDYINGVRPDDWTPDLEFAVINPDGSVTARNEYISGSMTKYWKWRSS